MEGMGLSGTAGLGGNATLRPHRLLVVDVLNPIVVHGASMRAEQLQTANVMLIGVYGPKQTAEV
jgi:hypothetical protein